MGIFDKDCPRCGAAVAVSAGDCECGFSFDPNSLEEAAQELEIIAQDEQLYENYLSARVAQTKEAISSAKIVLDRDPENPIIKNDLKNAEAEYKSACEEHQSQYEKLAKATKAADVAKEAMEKARIAREQQQTQKEAEARLEAEEARLRAVARTQATREQAAKEEEREKQLARKQAVLIKKQGQEILRQGEERLTKQARRAALAAHERQVAMAMALVSRADDDIKQARKFTDPDNKIDISGLGNPTTGHTTNGKKQTTKTIQSSIVVSSSVNQEQKKTKSNKHKHNHNHHHRHQEIAQARKQKAPVITKQPNLVFKARQAIKAAVALMSKTNQESAESRKLPELEHNKITPITGKPGNTTETARLTRKATPEFKAEQKRNSDRLQPLPKLAHNARPTCPHCTAEIKANSKKCKCGYVLDLTRRDGFDLVLSDADKDAMDVFSHISITKMS